MGADKSLARPDLKKTIKDLSCNATGRGLVGHQVDLTWAKTL